MFYSKNTRVLDFALLSILSIVPSPRKILETIKCRRTEKALNALLGVCFASTDRQNQSFLFLISSIVLILFDGEFKGCGLALFQCLIIQRLSVSHQILNQFNSHISGRKLSRESSNAQTAAYLMLSREGSIWHLAIMKD